MARLVEQDIAYAETAPYRVDGSAEFEARPAEVWAVILDYPAWPRWFSGVTSCRSTSDPSTGVGSTRRVSLVGPGSKIDERFIAWDEDERWAFTATDATPALWRSLVERILIEDLGNGRCRVTYRMAFEPSWWMRPLAGVFRKAMEGNLARATTALGVEVAGRRGPEG